MTDPRPICPIPPDAKVGDVVIAAYGPDAEIQYIDESIVDTVGYAYNWDGTCPGVENHCTGFIYADGRKPNLTRPAKPKRTQAQRDGAYLRRMAKGLESKKQFTQAHRLRKIADRLEKQQ